MDSTTNTAKTCICTGERYSVHCPDAFYQGGRILHILDTRSSDGKVAYTEINTSNVDSKAITTKVVNRASESPPSYAPRFNDEKNAEMGHFSDDCEDLFPRALKSKEALDRGVQNARITTGDSMMHEHRVDLRKFESLNVSGRALTDLSIGGFQVDLSKAAQKAALVAPLPPAKLPIIYVDHTMNFLHHFFQGLERIIGRDVVLEITSRTSFSEGEDVILMPLIEHAMKVGHEKKDNNITTFVKSVLMSTFEIDERSDPTDPERGLLVAANLWGFRYIECGFEVKEANLKMWLSMNYQDFKTLHFDTFKDSGVPAFVSEGVQTRYEPVRRRTYVADRIRDEHTFLKPKNSVTIEEVSDFYDDASTVRSSRRRHRQRKEPTLGSLLFGNRV